MVLLRVLLLLLLFLVYLRIGKILPVGGLKEKLISAVTNGITTVYLPLELSKELILLPSEVKDRLDIVLVEDYEDVYKRLFK